MINPDELRRGNLLIDNNGRYACVSEISGISLRCWTDLDPDIQFPFNSPDEDSFNPDGLSPILITPKILEKAGFVKHGIHWRIKYGDAFYLYGSTVFFAPSVMSEIEYVHHLQNLYFAMTREELEIKL